MKSLSYDAYNQLVQFYEQARPLLIDSRDLLQEMAPECGCSRPDVCHSCRNHNYAQEMVKRINKLTGGKE